MDTKKDLRILMLEDTPSDAELAEYELRKTGIAYIIKRVDTRSAFAQALAEFHPDIILSDYKLPDFDGVAALKMVQSDYPEVPVIMVTGALSDIEAVDLIHAGARDYVLKDRLARLAPAVQRALSAAQDERARKAAEEALRASEAKFRALVESSSDWIWEVNEQGVYTYASPQVYYILGYSVGEVVGKMPFDLMPPDEAVRMRAVFCSVTGERKPFRLLENVTLHKDGKTVFLESSGVPIIDALGVFRGYRGTDRDITERKRAEEALHENSRILERMFDSTHFCVVYLDRDFNFIRVNRAYAKACGAPPEYFPGKNHFQLYPHAENEAIFRKVVQTGEPFTISAKPFEFPDHPEWGVSYWDWTLHPLKAPDGSVDALLFVLLDVTERKHAEQALRQSEAEIRAIIEHSPVAMLVDVGVDEDEQISMMNRKFTELFGYTLEDVPDVRHWWPLAYPDGKYREEIRGEWLARVEKAVRRHNDIEPMEATVACKDGSNRYIRISLASIGSRNIITFEDLTERKQAEAALLRLNRTLKALSAGNHALIHGEDEKSLLENMCHAATEGGYVLAWVGYALQDEKKSIVPMAVSGEGKAYVEALDVTWDDQLLGRGPTGTAARTGQTQIAHDIRTDPRMEPWREAATKYGFASSIALPLKENGRVIGTLTIYAAEPKAFSPDQVALLEEMASDLAFGIVNLRTRNERDEAVKGRQHYIERLRASLEEALQAIAATVEMRDPYTAGHQRRVAHLATAIARELNLPEEQVHGIHLAGIVHDLGKIHIPAEILSKPGRLSEIEYSFIKTHPQAGYDILKGIEFPWPIAQTVLQHHERLGGSGYPQGLKDEQILLEAKILAVADVVEAMMSHRPYRPSVGLDAALEEITRQRGVSYDPAAVDACLALFREKGFVFE